MTVSATEELLTSDEARARLQIGVKTFRKLVAAGEIEASRVGHRGFRVSEQALADYEQRTAGLTLTSDDVCARLQIGVKTFRKLVAAGEIEAVKIAGQGNRWRLREAALADYLRRNTVQATQ